MNAEQNRVCEPGFRLKGLCAFGSSKTSAPIRHAPAINSRATTDQTERHENTKCFYQPTFHYPLASCQFHALARTHPYCVGLRASAGAHQFLLPHSFCVISPDASRGYEPVHFWNASGDIRGGAE